MTKSEQIAHKNLIAKLEKYKAKLDIIEQENKEFKKENSKLKIEKEILTKNNAKLGEIATKKCDELYNEISKLNKEVVDANAKKKEDAKTIKKLEKTIETLKAVITDLKSSKIKNSSNSSKPSSTNGFKKVIQNNREKSNKLKGGQIGRKGKTLKTVEKPTKIINVYGNDICECGGKIVYTCEYIKKQVIDILNEVETIEYRYYKGKCDKCGKEYIANIPAEHNNPIQYSEKIRNIVPLIRNIGNTSVETTGNLLNLLFEELKLSSGFIHRQEHILAQKCEPVVEKIREFLLQSSVAHNDETGLRINDALGCCMCFSNEFAVVYGMFKNKSQASFDEFRMFQTFSGILVHDHNKAYYKYLSIVHAECNVHILRYLKYVIDMFKRKGAQKIREFLQQIYKEKLDAIANNIHEFSEERIAEIETKYLNLLDEWEKEFNQYVSKMKNISKALREEKNLFTRLRKYKEEHLRFIKNFKVPFENNEAERNLRKIKMKINVSQRFGKLECARDYAIIKSIIETAKKQKKDIVKVFSEISKGNYDVFDLEVKKDARNWENVS